MFLLRVIAGIPLWDWILQALLTAGVALTWFFPRKPPRVPNDEDWRLRNIESSLWNLEEDFKHAKAAARTPQAGSKGVSQSTGGHKLNAGQSWSGKTSVAVPAGSRVGYESSKSQDESDKLAAKVSVSTFLYSAAPESDGTFKPSRLVAERKEESLYELELDASGTSATLKIICDSTRVAAALEGPRHYLEPVCEYTEAPTNATGIVEVKAGRVVQEEERWRIQDRIKIRFR